MRIIEIILKLAFVVTAIILATHSTVVSALLHFLIVSLLLGIVLLFNKNSSYGSWGNSKRDYAMRRVEGTILIIATIVGYLIVR